MEKREKVKNDFLNTILEQRGMSPDEFFGNVSFSRSTFYRCFKNKVNGFPSFKIHQIAEMAKVLSLSYQECEQYFGYVPSALTDHAAKRTDIIQDIMLSPSPLDGKNTNSEFEFYDEVKEENVRNKFNLTLLSVTDTADKIVKTKTIWSDDEKEDSFYHYKLTIKLYNCSQLPICSLLSRLFYSIEKIFFDSKKSYRVKVMHYMPNYEGDSADRATNSLKLLKQTLPTRAFCCEYEQILEPLSPYVWSDGNDICIIKYSRLAVNRKNTIEDERNQPKRDQVYEHFLIKFAKDSITNALRAFVTRLGEPLYLYKFFTCDTRLISQNEESYPSVLKTSKLFLKELLYNSAMTIGTDFCFDCIHYQYWNDLFEKYKNDDLIINYLQQLFHLEPAVLLNSSIKNLLEVIKVRYESRCQKEDITIMWEEGVKEFATKRMISDLLVDGTSKDILNIFQFDPEQIIRILEDIMDSINSRDEAKKQKFYIIKSNSHGDFRLKCSVIRNYGINICADKCFSKNIGSSFLEDAEVANLLYNYWMDKIASRNRTEFYYSSDVQIMSDKEAVAFISGLIDDVKNSIS